jgi:hypothetical protein
MMPIDRVQGVDRQSVDEAAIILGVSRSTLDRVVLDLGDGRHGIEVCAPRPLTKG